MFPGGKAGKALSNMAFLMLLRRMGMRTAYQGLGAMFATIELQKQAVADRYYHQLHPKPWAKSPEEAAWPRMFSSSARRF